MDALLRDLKIGLRVLLKSPAFTAAAVITLALGIGANTAIFSVVSSVLLRDLPYQDSDRLAMIWNDYGSGGQSLPAGSAPHYRDYTQRARSFEGFAGAMNGTAELTGPNGAQQVDMAAVTANFFPLLGVKPILGRTFLPEEAVLNGPNVAMLTYRLWQERFGGRSDVIGQTVSISRVPNTIVGVLPRDWELELPPEKFMTDAAEVYKPLQINVDTVPRNLTGMTVMGRLKPGVTWAQAQGEMSNIASQLRKEHTVHQMSGLQIRVVPLKDDIVKRARLPLLVMMGAVGFVLLIACGNVANLLLARATARKREMAIRSALGATGLQLARQALAESLVVSLMGGLTGVLLARWGVDLLLALKPANLPRLNEIAMGGTALAYTGGIAVLTALLFGLAPALQAARPDLNQLIVDGGRASRGLTKTKIGGALIVGQVALSVLLLIGGGLLLRSFAELQKVQPGFRADNVLTFRVFLPVTAYPTLPMTQDADRRILQQLQNVPGIEVAGAISKLPLTGSGPQTPYAWDDETASKWESISADSRPVSADYFRSMGINFLAGRPFTEEDDATHPGVVIVDDMLAKKAWPGENAIGKRLLIDDPQKPHQWLTVVGVIAHVRSHDLAVNVREQVYLSYLQRPARFMYFTLKTKGDPADSIPAAIAAVHKVDPDLAVHLVAPMQQYVSLAMAQARFTLLLSGIFGGLALVLTAVGIYGLISYFTSLRTREIGIRLALGAQRGAIHRMVLQEGLSLTLGGIVVGVVAALLLTRMLVDLLYGVSARDPITFVSIPLVLVTIALLATYLPARKATKIDPMVALRYE